METITIHGSQYAALRQAATSWFRLRANSALSSEFDQILSEVEACGLDNLAEEIAEDWEQNKKELAKENLGKVDPIFGDFFKTIGMILKPE